jgi:type II restriction enzyme
VFTESWLAAHLFCPSCGERRIGRYPNNSPVADFYCGQCREQFELKSQRGRFGPRVADGAYGAKMLRLASDTSPNLMLMNYDLARFAVTDLFFVPKQFFTAAIIEARPPLAPTARRAGWVGSKIVRPLRRAGARHLPRFAVEECPKAARCGWRPPPPRFAWSPSPARQGRNAARRWSGTRCWRSGARPCSCARPGSGRAAG